MTLWERLRKAVRPAGFVPAGGSSHPNDEEIARQLQLRYDRERLEAYQRLHQTAAADQAYARELQAALDSEAKQRQQPPPPQPPQPPRQQQPAPQRPSLPSWFPWPLPALQQIGGWAGRVLNCHVCHNNIFALQRGSQIVWSETPFWGDKYCPAHNSDGTKRCTSCTRLHPIGEEWVELQDRRPLCLPCLSTTVVDTADAQPLYDELLAFYARLGMPLPTRPPLMLVETSALNSAENRETHGQGRGQGPVFHSRGLCLSMEYQTFWSVSRAAGLFPFSVQPRATPISSTHCEVSAILVLYGLPRLLTGSILAHELMHAWLRLSGFSHRHLPLQLEEGLAQLMAFLWLESQHPQVWLECQHPQGEEQRLAQFFLYQLHNDPSPVYGDGFRAAHAAYHTWGLEGVVAHVRQTGQLPN